VNGTSVDQHGDRVDGPSVDRCGDRLMDPVLVNVGRSGPVSVDVGGWMDQDGHRMST